MTRPRPSSPAAPSARGMVHEAHAQRRPPWRRRVRSAGGLLGAGLVGMLDGILFHDLLGWHHFVDVPGRAAEVSDGLFHLAMWILVLAGIAVLWQARPRLSEPRAGRVLVGSALVGAGTLQLLDAVVDHALLRLHWLHPQGDVAAWEAGYLLVSLVLVLAGWRIVRGAAHRRRTATRRRTRRTPAP